MASREALALTAALALAGCGPSETCVNDRATLERTERELHRKCQADSMAVFVATDQGTPGECRNLKSEVTRRSEAAKSCH